MFVYEKENLDLIPLDLVGFQMQVEMVSIGGVDRGVLRLVGVVHHAVLAIFHIGVHFHIELELNQVCSSSSLWALHRMAR